MTPPYPLFPFFVTISIIVRLMTKRQKKITEIFTRLFGLDPTQRIKDGNFFRLVMR